MPYQIAWDDAEKTIVRQTYIGKVNTEDFTGMVKDNANMLATVEHPVDIIIDVTKIDMGVMGMITFARHANRFVPKNQRFVVIVGAKGNIVNLIDMVKRLAPNATGNSYFVDTDEEVYRLLAEKRTNLS